MAARKASGSKRGGAPGARRGDHPGEKIAAKATVPRPLLQAVYDGQHCLGHLLARGKLGFEAFDADDRSLGVCADARAAADAISAKAAAS
jgi:hypothetical protein